VQLTHLVQLKDSGLVLGRAMEMSLGQHLASRWVEKRAAHLELLKGLDQNLERCWAPHSVLWMAHCLAMNSQTVQHWDGYLVPTKGSVGLKERRSVQLTRSVPN
jgi:hypothetical protein